MCHVTRVRFQIVDNYQINLKNEILSNLKQGLVEQRYCPALVINCTVHLAEFKKVMHVNLNGVEIRVRYFSLTCNELMIE
jgi:hypothetical protein